MINWKLLAAAILLSAGVCPGAGPAADLFISPAGSDDWSGRLAEPNSDQTDGPFASLDRARREVRLLKKEKRGAITVLIREGRYQLNETVVFGLADSGSEGAPITYAAYPGEKPLFTSGVKIDDWKLVERPLPYLPAVAEGKVYEAEIEGTFKTLYDRDGLLPRARSKGFIPPRDGSKTRLHCPPGLLRNWANVKDMEVVVRPHHAWILNILPVDRIEPGNDVVHTAVNATYAMKSLHFLKTTESCWLENVLSELDEPGEWVVHSEEKKLYFWPREQTEVYAPRLTEFIRLEGEIHDERPQDLPVSHLIFEGLTFTQGERYTVNAADAGLQHDWDFLDKGNALFRLRGAEDCVVRDCHFLESGSGAIRIDLHGQRNRIEGNHIEQMGGAGILLAGYGPGTKDSNKQNLIENNHVHHVGRIYWHSPGIMVWQSGENRIANNLVHHTPYTGIIVSGCMTRFFSKGGRELGRTLRKEEIGQLPKDYGIEDVRPFLHSYDNLIEYNEIHHAMEKMGDGNAFYIRGAGAGNVFRRNYVHHLVAPMIMQCGIRTDGGQRDTTFAENIIYKCTSQGIMMKLNTRVENNFIIDVIAPPRGYYLALREGPLTGGSIKRNVFYSSSREAVFIDERGRAEGPPTEDRRGRLHARSQDADTDYNIYFNAADPQMGEAMLRRQRAKGIDQHSRAADPLFVDLDKEDFRFQSDSPAHALGIVPIDREQIGLRERASDE
ncbi:MAG: right-handed parallel beta-helix repeat-containing protein [Verrucomicrobiota bacterium JB023]|nr:right-handed parallel beta-helix repeat-containing protein [Verrucomicrobiota bacterium JB023]